MTVRRSIRCTLLGLLAIGLCVPVYADTVSEEDVKLALIYKIARFVTWPEVSGQPGAPFRICMAENTIFDLAKDRFTGRHIRDRDIEVRLLTESPIDLSERCDVFYIARVNKERVTKFLEISSGEPVLTVSDTPDFARNGGMIGLSTRSNSVTISINVAAYEASGLVVSSQLLELAELVDDTPGSRR